MTHEFGRCEPKEMENEMNGMDLQKNYHIYIF